MNKRLRNVSGGLDVNIIGGGTLNTDKVGILDNSLSGSAIDLNLKEKEHYTKTLINNKGILD